MDALENLTDVLHAIKEDPELRSLFVEILKFGSMTQQVRVAKLNERLEEQDAPEEVRSFVALLKNDQLAHRVLRELESV